jgi:hypothetical protein
MPSLLAALIILQEEEGGDTSINFLARQLYDREALSKSQATVFNDVRQLWKRARKRLGDHSEALPSGERYVLAGRDQADGPRTVYIDWDDVKRYQDQGLHTEALSLMTKGLPLVGLREKPGGILDLIGKVHARVTDKRNTILREGQDFETRTWDQLAEKYGNKRPADWIPRFVAAPVPVSLPADRRTSRPIERPKLLGPFTENDLFEPCEEGRLRFYREYEEMSRSGGDMWWAWGSHQWLGAYVAFWHKTHDTPCEDIKFTYSGDVYDAARFGLKDVDAPKVKATLIEAPKQLTDNDNKAIICGRTNWGLAHEWAKDNSDALLADPANLSVFGVRGRPVYPNILGVHTLVQTADGFLLFALRSPEVDFHERTWSASFEESVSVGPREFTGPLSGDERVIHAIQGGLYEEWGIDEEAIRDTSLLAIGREWVREPGREGSTSLNLSPTILTACRLTLSLEEVWRSLDEVTYIPDREEHRAWAGCHFPDRAGVLRFVAAAKGRNDSANMLEELCAAAGKVELEMYPRSASHIRDRGLMPTSPARLVLGSAWLEYRKGIDKRT